MSNLSPELTEIRELAALCAPSVAVSLRRLADVMEQKLRPSNEPCSVPGLRSMGFMPYGTHVDLVMSFDSMKNAQTARDNITKWATTQLPKTGQSSGDFDKDLARVNAIRNDLWLDDHASNHDVEFLIGFIDNLWREYSRANEKLSASTPPFSLPPLNADLIDILGRPNFMCAGIATRLRDFGFEIKRKAEHEQAAVAHWCLGLYLQHGDAWEAKANEFLSSSPTKEVSL